MAGGKITKAQMQHNRWRLETFYPEFIYERKPKVVHQEAPMFSKKTACGRRLTKRMHYAWGTLKLITCKTCWKKAAK